MNDRKENRLWILFSVFFKISAVSVGGGLTMLPLMDREFVEKRGWLTESDMVDIVAAVQSVPGVIAVNMAIMIGRKAAGFPGILAASFGVVIPPVIVIVALASVVTRLSGNETVSNIFRGVRAAVAALILLSVVRMSKTILKGVFPAVVAVFGFLLLVVFEWNAVILIFVSALAGLCMEGVRRILKRGGGVS